MSNQKQAAVSKNLKVLARQLHLAGEPNRLKILCAIFDQDKICVSDISAKTKLNIPIVSHHLQTLAKGGLLRSERTGKKICYSFGDELIIKYLKKLICKCK